MSPLLFGDGNQTMHCVKLSEKNLLKMVKHNLQIAVYIKMVTYEVTF